MATIQPDEVKRFVIYSIANPNELKTNYFDQQNLNLSMLNDDCILKILEWLPLDDLCLFSRTCKRLQALCGIEFRRTFSNEANRDVEIRLLSNGKLRYENYVKYFQNFIKSLFIRSGVHKHHKAIVSFVKDKCDPNLQEITICGDLKLVPFCEKIESFLKTVEIVQLKSRRKKGRDESTFLKYCPNLTTISLHDLWHEENVDAILEEKYQKLKIFYWQRPRLDQRRAEKFKIFLQQNAQIQCMELIFGFVEANAQIKDQQRIAMIGDIQTIVDFAINLEHLSLNLNEVFTQSSEQICGYLKVLCDRDTFKSLHLEFRDGHLLTLHANQLANFKQLTKISLAAGKVVDLLRAVLPMVYLKSIVIRSGITLETMQLRTPVPVPFFGYTAPTTFVVLPQIEELTIEVANAQESLALIMQVARYWVNLKKILMPGINATSFPIAELNRERMKLTNACELTIFTDAMDIATNADHNLVKLKCVKFREQIFLE